MGPEMSFIGVDLHKKLITVCVASKSCTIVARKILDCNLVGQIVR
jgi:hypothetical protein